MELPPEGISSSVRLEHPHCPVVPQPRRRHRFNGLPQPCASSSSWWRTCQIMYIGEAEQGSGGSIAAKPQTTSARKQGGAVTRARCSEEALARRRSPVPMPRSADGCRVTSKHSIQVDLPAGFVEDADMLGREVVAAIGQRLPAGGIVEDLVSIFEEPLVLQVGRRPGAWGKNEAGTAHHAACPVGTPDGMARRVRRGASCRIRRRMPGSSKSPHCQNRWQPGDHPIVAGSNPPTVTKRCSSSSRVQARKASASVRGGLRSHGRPGRTTDRDDGPEPVELGCDTAGLGDARPGEGSRTRDRSALREPRCQPEQMPVGSK